MLTIESPSRLKTVRAKQRVKGAKFFGVIPSQIFENLCAVAIVKMLSSKVGLACSCEIKIVDIVVPVTSGC